MGSRQRALAGKIPPELHYRHMSHTITIRLSRELAEWLAETAERTGVPQGKVVRDQLEKARAAEGSRRHMRWAGYIKDAPKDLSTRKGFSRK
jgi:hypothetical protein